jgi:hypothetical protein
MANQVHVELGGFLEGRAVHLGLPILGEPRPAKGVHDGGQWGEELAPARLAT